MGVAKSSSFAEQRRAPRHEVSIRAWLHRSGQARFAIHVVDISTHGMMARSSAALAVGERVTLDLPIAGRREALVRWSLGGRIGCELLQPLSEVICTRILAHPPPPPSPWERF
ncbi:MAG: PilZ domain-containing protein [Sphingomonadaceae bacterium]|nr:PilZ domain-containing protein [Sphingomonadaceae bacterium]